MDRDKRIGQRMRDERTSEQMSCEKEVKVRKELKWDAMIQKRL